MSSSIYFRFKSQKQPVSIPFDGATLSVFEIKRDIITLSKLGDGTDFDLEIYSADSNEKYDDDTSQVPRNSTVIARRLPAARPGSGRAARYVTGKMPVSAKNAHRVETSAATAAKTSAPVNGTIGGGRAMTEEERLQEVMNANTESWKEDAQGMSHRPVVRSFNKSAPVPDKPLPPGYICHRCGEKGHWIQACPTNNDSTFDGRPKFKRTTGIPRSFLKVVEKPTEVGEDGKIDVSKLPQGVMYTANGEWVVAEADHATWEKILEKQSAAAEKAKEAASGDQELRDRGLECPMHKGMFNEPVKTPCCSKTYCRDCIENALLDGDLVCPNCGEQVLLDKLELDDEMVTKIKNFQEEKKADNKKDKEAGRSPAADTPKGESPKVEEGKSPAPTSVPEVKVNGESRSPSPNSKKRAADEELPNDRKPSNPAAEAVKQAASKLGTPTPNSSSTSNTPKPVQPPIAPAKDIAEFQKQMNAMASSMSGMQGGMPAMMNPMMGGFNPAMMGMNMNMGMNPAMMNMNMPNFNGGMNGMGGQMNGWNGNQQQMMGNGGWQGRGGGMQNGFGRGGMQQNGNNGGGQNDSPYMRQPVNPNRHRGRNNRPRSQDWRQL